MVHQAVEEEQMRARLHGTLERRGGTIGPGDGRLQQPGAATSQFCAARIQSRNQRGVTFHDDGCPESSSD